MSLVLKRGWDPPNLFYFWEHLEFRSITCEGAVWGTEGVAVSEGAYFLWKAAVSWNQNFSDVAQDWTGAISHSETAGDSARMLAVHSSLYLIGRGGLALGFPYAASFPCCVAVLGHFSHWSYPILHKDLDIPRMKDTACITQQHWLVQKKLVQDSPWIPA